MAMGNPKDLRLSAMGKISRRPIPDGMAPEGSSSGDEVIIG
jgi:hypothetical protein